MSGCATSSIAPTFLPLIHRRCGRRHGSGALSSHFRDAIKKKNKTGWQFRKRIPEVHSWASRSRLSKLKSSGAQRTLQERCGSIKKMSHHITLPLRNWKFYCN